MPVVGVGPAAHLAVPVLRVPQPLAAAARVRRDPADRLRVRDSVGEAQLGAAVQLLGVALAGQPEAVVRAVAVEQLEAAVQVAVVEQLAAAVQERPGRKVRRAAADPPLKILRSRHRQMRRT